jgi:acyl-CoA synthetase (AMP-forming)/AMP-acid ligase II
MILKKFLLLEKNKKKIFFFPLQKINLSGLDFFYAVCNLSMYFKGIERNKKIAILYDNSIEYLIISFYVMLKNLTLVPINPVLSKSEILQIYKNSNSDIIISGKENFFKLKKIKKKIKFNFDVRITNKILKNYKNIFKIGKKKNHPLLLLYTSGSTGSPKGALLSEKNITSNSLVISNHHKLKKKSSTLVLMPMFHNNGFIISFMSSFLVGTKIIIAPANFIIYKFWEIVKKYSINYTSLMPAVLSMILKFGGSHKNQSLKIIACGGQKLSINLQKRFEKKFKTKIIEHYGLTETTSISSINSLTNRNYKSVGRPIKGTSIKVYDYKLKKLKKTGYGEISISGDNVFIGYYKNEKLNNDKWFKKYFKTGDYGFIDKEKNLFFSSRKDFLIIKGGENVYPAEIENVIYRFDEVIECGVVGYKDNIYGEEVYAFVKLKKYTKKKEEYLKKLLSINLARFKIPKKIFFLQKDIKLKELPKTITKKIKYKDLQIILKNEI